MPPEDQRLSDSRFAIFSRLSREYEMGELPNRQLSNADDRQKSRTSIRGAEGEVIIRSAKSLIRSDVGQVI